MTMDASGKLANLLIALALGVRDETNVGRRSGKLAADKREFHRWRVTKWEYGEKGVNISATSEYVARDSWDMAPIRIRDLVSERQEYRTVLKALTEVAGPEGDPRPKLDLFVRVVARLCLLEAGCRRSRLETVVKRFMADLQGEPQRCAVTVGVEGLLVFSQPVCFRASPMKVALRKSTPADVEVEMPVAPVGVQLMQTPTAVLELKLRVRRFIDLQVVLEKVATILRLFRVASVRFPRFTPHSESVTEFFPTGTVSYGARSAAIEKGKLYEDDAVRLPAFWRKMQDAIPPSFYDFHVQKADSISIAYQRYNDALFRNGLLERRVANAVMGLEALFLRGSERQDLSYRLRMRAARLLALLGHTGSQVSDTIHKAYGVRSTFVHGSHIDEKAKRRLEEEPDGATGFAKRVLNYLRLSIVCTLLMGISKEDLIENLDAGLLDPTEVEKLRKRLGRAKELLAS